jgi:hypothetical protein
VTLAISQDCLAGQVFLESSADGEDDLRQRQLHLEQRITRLRHQEKLNAVLNDVGGPVACAGHTRKHRTARVSQPQALDQLKPQLIAAQELENKAQFLDDEVCWAPHHEARACRASYHNMTIFRSRPWRTRTRG